MEIFAGILIFAVFLGIIYFAYFYKKDEVTEEEQSNRVNQSLGISGAGVSAPTNSGLNVTDLVVAGLVYNELTRHSSSNDSTGFSGSDFNSNSSDNSWSGNGGEFSGGGASGDWSDN